MTAAKGDIVHINDLFWTVQGEGANAGRRALFVRMPHCNLQCAWCDTQFNTFTEMHLDELERTALEEEARFAVITGGEPMLHRHTPKVVRRLKQLGFEVATETNGTAPIVDGIDWVCVSPKADTERLGKPAHWARPDVLAIADEIKLVVDRDFDFTVAERYAAYGERAHLWLSPEYGAMHVMVGRILDFQQTYPQWRLNLQTHKWIQIA